MKTKIIKIFLIFAVFLAIFSFFRDKNVAYAKQGEEEKSVEDGTYEVLENLTLKAWKIIIRRFRTTKARLSRAVSRNF